MLSREPLRIVDGILDYLGETSDDYVECYEEIARTYYLRRGPGLEVLSLFNLCDMLIQVFYPFGGSIIDVGCEFGYAINRIAPAFFFRKAALDISIEQLKQVAGGITRIRADAEDMPLLSGSFDVAICTNLFEHVKNEKALVSELYRVLKSGGLLLFACPWKQDLSVYESKEYKERFRQYKWKHLRSVDEETVKAAFSRFDILARTEITSAMAEMELTPYSVIFILMRKKVE